MKRAMLILAGGLLAASVILLLPLAPHSGRAFAATPVPMVPEVPHYKCYQMSGTAPATPPVRLETQFGTVNNVAVGLPTRLCLAALKNGEGDVNVPDVECYTITGQPPNRTVSLQTQFGTTRNVTVGAPDELCAPVANAIANPPPPTPLATPGPLVQVPHYECYDITGSPLNVTVNLETRFGTELGMVVGAPTRLCLPALKNGEGNTSVPHVECFSITGPAATPVPILNLLTQFGSTTLDAPLTNPRELCVPVIKDLGVGGVQEMPDAAGGAAATSTAGQDASSPPYAAIAGAGIAVVLAVGAGGWYARRRWLT